MKGQLIRIYCQAGAKSYTLLVRQDNGTETGGDNLEPPVANIPAWAIVKVRENLFHRLCNSGADSVTMSAIPELRSLEVVGWRK